MIKLWGRKCPGNRLTDLPGGSVRQPVSWRRLIGNPGWMVVLVRHEKTQQPQSGPVGRFVRKIRGRTSATDK